MITAIYHCSIKIIGRGKMQSAVASAAYRSGQRLYDEYYGKTEDYTRKKGVVFTEIMLPENAPKEYSDRAVLWNSVEKAEKGAKAQLAREIEIALPAELPGKQQIRLAREYVQNNFVSAGMCADLCIHDKKDGNPHAHIMLTMRPIEGNGAWGAKQRKEYILDGGGNKIYDRKKQTYKCRSVPSTDWNEQYKAEEWRKAWAQAVNGALSENQIEERIDHRSYKRQGKEELPTVHMGSAARQMERRGIPTEKGEWNRQIREINARLKELRKKQSDIQKWISEYESKDGNLIEKLLRFKSNGEKFNQSAAPYLRNFKNLKDIQNLSKNIAFLQSNNILTAEDMSRKLDGDRRLREELRKGIIIKSRKLKELKNLIERCGSIKQYRQIYEIYENMRPSEKRERFYEDNRHEIVLFEAAKKELPEKITPKAWKEEYDKLLISLLEDNRRIDGLENGIARMETVRRNIDSLDRYENREKSERTKSYEMTV